MNRLTTLPATAAVVVLAAALSGCGAALQEERDPSATPTNDAQPAFRTAGCNLGEFWDRDALVRRAKYAEPAVGDADLEYYGPMIANDACSDADILMWQKLRRELGESDEICRIVWFDDYYSAVTYDIGCAVPVVVSDAAR